MGFFSNNYDDDIVTLGNIMLTNTSVQQETKHQTRRVILSEIQSVSIVNAGDGNGKKLMRLLCIVCIGLGFFGHNEKGFMLAGVFFVFSLFAKSGGYLIVMRTRDGGSTKFYISGYSKSQIEEFVDDMEYTMSGEWRND